MYLRRMLSDNQNKRLRFYFSENFHDAHISWNINIEFAKLSAKFGTLVEKEAEAFMPPSLSEQWTKYFLILPIMVQVSNIRKDFYI